MARLGGAVGVARSGRAGDGRLAPGQETGYEAWLQRLRAEARTLPGYLGVTTQRPAANGPREHVSAMRFDSLQSQQAFEAREIRARHIRRQI